MIDRRRIPSIDELLRHPEIREVSTKYSRILVRNTLRELVEAMRRRPEDYDADDITPEAISRRFLPALEAMLYPALKKVINATGTVLHTNLGRAPLARKALEAVLRVSEGYSNLELNLATGKRGQRIDPISDILVKLTGAEAAMAVNNNAGAVLLALSVMASGREVIVSRGELIEIGGKFRIPDVMAFSGAILREVGTTNRTHLQDYRNAVTPETALLFKAHRSNFGIVGFTKSVTLGELVELGRETETPVLYDLGSGCFFDGTPFGWSSPRVTKCIEMGADVVTFSGDKLLGGPQAGIIVGKARFVHRMMAHPLARALRLDKMTLAALDATLRLYLQPEKVMAELPGLRMLCLPESDIKRRSMLFLTRLRQEIGDAAEMRVAAGMSAVGGGALPLTELPTWCIEIYPREPSATEAAARLRAADPPVIARIARDRLVLDLRTVLAGEEDALFRALSEALK